MHELDGGKLDAVIHGGRCNKVEDARPGLTEDVPLLAMCAVGTSVGSEVCRVRYERVAYMERNKSG